MSVKRKTKPNPNQTVKNQAKVNPKKIEHKPNQTIVSVWFQFFDKKPNQLKPNPPVYLLFSPHQFILFTWSPCFTSWQGTQEGKKIGLKLFCYKMLANNWIDVSWWWQILALNKLYWQSIWCVTAFGLIGLSLCLKDMTFEGTDDPCFIKIKGKWNELEEWRRRDVHCVFWTENLKNDIID